MSQLHDDLDHRVNDRLRQWAVDSVALYDMAGVDPRLAIADVIAALMKFLARGVVTLKIPDKEFIENFAHLVVQARREDQEEDRDASRPH